MYRKDYTLELSGVGKVRDFKLIELASNYPLPQVINPVLQVDDDSMNTPEGRYAQYVMKGSGLIEIRYVAETHSVRVTAATDHAWDDTEFIEIIVRCHINSHFNAAKNA
ncbi:MAG: hypothetical protein JWO55_46 [Candidatus Saccharibacteria bacterium]|jgi:hypothetical protein|nr:hypothetical protein [Candidatus Saccharibacteria bacterium]